MAPKASATRACMDLTVLTVLVTAGWSGSVRPRYTLVVLITDPTCTPHRVTVWAYCLAAKASQ